jgi:cytochrome c oxidase subunit 2
MKQFNAISLALIAGLFLVSSAQAAGDAAKGKGLYAVCSSCHGANGEGNAALNAPQIAGQQEWYVARQLNNYKAGIRGTHPEDVYGAQMRPMSMTLANEQAVNDVSAYIASLKPKPVAQTVKGDAAKGKAAFAVCASCHGANGEGNQALNAPRISTQYDWYTVRQINNFKKGIRGANPKDVYGAQMRPMSMTLATDQAVNDVAAFLASLK